MTYSPLGHHLTLPENATPLEIEAIALVMAAQSIRAAQEAFHKTHKQAGLDAIMQASMYITFGEWE
jgi:hypothetical protein